MSKMKPNVNGMLADNDRVALIKKRSLVNPLLSPKERIAVVAACDTLSAVFTKKCVEYGVTPDVSSARQPRRSRKEAASANGHAKA